MNWLPDVVAFFESSVLVPCPMDRRCEPNEVAAFSDQTDLAFVHAFLVN